MLLSIADLLVENAAAVRRSRVYHLTHDHRLVAVVDLKRSVGVLPDATLPDIERASWLPRPDSADFIPESFAKRDTRELLWDYASRTERAVLPARYRAEPIFLRRAPLLPQKVMSDAQLFVLRELAQAPRKLEQLASASRFSMDEIAQALAAFYLIGSVTTSPERVPAVSDAEDSASGWAWYLSSHAGDAPPIPDVTAPGALRRQKE